MCSTPDNYPKNSFIVNVFEKIEEIIVDDGNHYEIVFHRHMPGILHKPSDLAVNNAILFLYRDLQIIYRDTDIDEDFFNGSKDKVDYAAHTLIKLTQYLIKKDDDLNFFVKVPRVSDFRFRIYHIILLRVIDSFMDYLLFTQKRVAPNRRAFLNLKQGIKTAEDFVEEFVFQHVSPRDFFGREMKKETLN